MRMNVQVLKECDEARKKSDEDNKRLFKEITNKDEDLLNVRKIIQRQREEISELTNRFDLVKEEYDLFRHEASSKYELSVSNSEAVEAEAEHLREVLS